MIADGRQDLGFRVQGSGFRVQGSGFRRRISLSVEGVIRALWLVLLERVLPPRVVRRIRVVCRALR